MHFIHSAVGKDLRRRMREWWVLVLWLGIPLLVGGLMTLISGGGGNTPTATLWIADEDQSMVSGLIPMYFGQGQLADMVDVETVSLVDGQARIDRGQGSALLVIPPGFGDAVLQDTPTRLLLVTNPSQQILPGIVEESLSILVDGAFYLQRVFGDDMQTVLGLIETGALEAAPTAELSASMGEAFGRLSGILFPPLIQLAATVPEPPALPITFSLLYFPGVLLMALLFTSQGLSDELWREKDLGTLRRVMSTPQTSTRFYVGKLLYSGLVLLAVCAAIAVLGFSYHGLRWSKLPVTLLLLVSAGWVLWLLFCLVQLWSRTRRAATLIGTLLVFPLMMLGGSFFPFESMPAWMVSVGRWTPNGLVLNQLKDFLFYERTALGLMPVLGALWVTGLALFALCAQRLKAFARGTA